MDALRRSVAQEKRTSAKEGTQAHRGLDEPGPAKTQWAAVSVGKAKAPVHRPGLS
jgi:hypothetical protein